MADGRQETPEHSKPEQCALNEKILLIKASRLGLTLEETVEDTARGWNREGQLEAWNKDDVSPLNSEQQLVSCAKESPISHCIRGTALSFFQRYILSGSLFSTYRETPEELNNKEWQYISVWAGGFNKFGR